MMFCFLPESDEMYFRYYIQFHGIKGSDVRRRENAGLLRLRLV